MIVGLNLADLAEIAASEGDKEHFAKAMYPNNRVRV